MEYTIVDGDLDFVIEKVNELIKQGWKLQGGIATSTHKHPFDEDDPNLYTSYTQAMIMEKP